MSDEPAEQSSDLVDLTGVSLTKLGAVPGSVLAASLRRILAELDSDTEPVAGFQSAI